MHGIKSEMQQIESYGYVISDRLYCAGKTCHGYKVVQEVQRKGSFCI